MSNKKTHAELSAILAKAASQVEVGARYEHYKHQTYRVLALALRGDENEPCVVYQAEYGDRITFVHTVADWMKQMDVDGQKVNRFTKL